MGPMKRTKGAALAIAAMLMPTAVLAQQRTIYGSDGRVIAREVTGSNGDVTFYGADGRVDARSSTDSQGTTTIYGADGRRAGTVTPQLKGKP
jgi:hypothetical protein